MSRDGTDYGEREALLEQKMDNVRHQLERGDVLIVARRPMGGSETLEARLRVASPGIVFDLETESTNVVRSDGIVR